MKICEDCIKQDVCKFNEEVLMCQHKRTDTLYSPCVTTATVTLDPSWINDAYPPWDVGDYPLAPQISWC